MKLSLFRLLLTGSIGLLFLFIGCGGDDDDEELTEPIFDPVGAQVLVDSANTWLESILFNLVNSDDIDKPGDINFTVPYNLYLEALELCGTHPGANFGAGLLDIIMISQDPEFQLAFEKWRQFGERDDMFEADSPIGGPTVAAGPVLRLDEVSIPIESPLVTTRSMCRIAAQGDPTISELQTIFLDKFLPRIKDAVEHLDAVTDSTTFTFIVTPMMQGDYREDPVELDMTEVHSMLAGIQVLRAVLLHFCAYDLDLDPYTGDAMRAALTQGSSFMTLLDDGEDRMAEAREAWLGVVENLDAGIRFLESETDYQGDDFIRIDERDGMTREELDSLKHYIPLVKSALDDKNTFTFDINARNESITISLKNFLDTPIPDLKELFPPYTVSLATQEIRWRYEQDWYSEPATVEIPSAGFYYWNRSQEWRHGETSGPWEWRSNFGVPEWDAAWDEMVDNYSDKAYFYLSFDYSEDLYPGTQDIYSWVNFRYKEATGWRYIPRITWQADSFSEWTLPDPTFGGLFPGMTDSRFKSLFNLTEDDWEKTEDWELW